MFQALTGLLVAFLVTEGGRAESEPSRAPCQGPPLTPGPEYKQIPCKCHLGSWPETWGRAAFCLRGSPGAVLERDFGALVSTDGQT